MAKKEDVKLPKFPKECLKYKGNIMCAKMQEWREAWLKAAQECEQLEDIPIVTHDDYIHLATRKNTIREMLGET